MDLQYSIFKKIVPLWQNTKWYISENKTSDCSIKEELYFTIVLSTHTRLGHAIEDLAIKKEFCIFCMYASLNNVRKTIFRYMTLENELTKLEQMLLDEIKDAMNDICILINSNYKRNDDGCVLIKNEAIKSLTKQDKKDIDYLLSRY